MAGCGRDWCQGNRRSASEDRPAGWPRIGSQALAMVQVALEETANPPKMIMLAPGTGGQATVNKACDGSGAPAAPADV